jgi:Flp pilus assembly pilin Flp
MRPAPASATEAPLRPYVCVRTAISALRDHEGGQTISEYALIIVSIAVPLIVAMLFFAGKLDNLTWDIGTSTPKTKTRSAMECDPNYGGGCVPPYPPDLDCADLRALGISLPVRIVGASDPHHLDEDGDGLGC